jgi:hypothetical protein
MKRLHLLALLAASWTAWTAQACVINSDCDDANVCNGSETCQAGVCIPGSNLTCDDGNPCTIDTCEPVPGCVFTPANGCLLTGKKFRLGIGRDLRMGIQTAAEMAGVAFPANNTADDPVINAASIRVFTTAGDMFDNTYPLPMHNWEYLGVPGENKGYRYKDFHNEDGPINILVIKNGRKNKLKGRGPLLNYTLNSDPEPVNVVLRMGSTGRLFCLLFGGRTKFYSGVRFSAEAAPPPTSCP